MTIASPKGNDINVLLVWWCFLDFYGQYECSLLPTATVSQKTVKWPWPWQRRALWVACRRCLGPGESGWFGKRVGKSFADSMKALYIMWIGTDIMIWYDMQISLISFLTWLKYVEIKDPEDVTCQAQLTARMARAALATAASASRDQHGEKRDVWLLLCEVRATHCAIWNAEAWRILKAFCLVKHSYLLKTGIQMSRTEISFSNDHYFSSFPVIGNHMTIEYLPVGSTCVGWRPSKRLGWHHLLRLAPQELSTSIFRAVLRYIYIYKNMYALHSIANGRLHASRQGNL